MSFITKGLCREFAKCCMDLFKVTIVAAFITPWISSDNLEEGVTLWAGIMAGVFFTLGVTFHRIADHMAGLD